MKYEKIISFALSALSIFALAGCGSFNEWADSQTVTINGTKTEVLEQSEEAYSVEGFFDANDEEVIYHNTGGGYVCSAGDVSVYMPCDNTTEEHNPIVKHFVYLKGEDGKIKVFSISSECLATLVAMTDKNIYLDYSKTSEESLLGTFTNNGYTWNGFDFTYVSALPNTELPTELTTGAT